MFLNTKKGYPDKDTINYQDSPLMGTIYNKIMSFVL